MEYTEKELKAIEDKHRLKYAAIYKIPLQSHMQHGIVMEHTISIIAKKYGLVIADVWTMITITTIVNSKKLVLSAKIEDIWALTNRSRQTVSTSLRNLVKGGYIKRVTEESVVLTYKAREIMREYGLIYQEKAVEVLRKIDQVENSGKKFA